MVVLGYRFGALARKALKETLDDNLLGLAAETAYYFFFSLFPLLLFIAPLLSLVGNKQETFALFTSQLQQVVPSEGWALIGGVIRDVVYAKNAPGLMSPTRAPEAARAMARFVATVDLPTPPLPLETAMMRPRCG